MRAGRAGRVLGVAVCVYSGWQLHDVMFSMLSQLHDSALFELSGVVPFVIWRLAGDGMYSKSSRKTEMEGKRERERERGRGMEM